METTDKASFNGSCEYCLACVHSCPQKALTLAHGERNPHPRFRNENISLADIRRANSQIGGFYKFKIFMIQL